MKTWLLSLCLALAMTAAMPALAAGGMRMAQSEACKASCKANADACRTQCGEPEEQEQCIFGDCSPSECKGQCQTFETNCLMRCAKLGG